MAASDVVSALKSLYSSVGKLTIKKQRDTIYLMVISAMEKKIKKGVGYFFVTPESFSLFLHASQGSINVNVMNKCVNTGSVPIHIIIHWMFNIHQWPSS